MNNRERDSTFPVLRNCRLFHGLTDDNLQLVSTLAVRRDYSTNEVIFKQGDQPVGVFIVETGKAKIYRTGDNGSQHVLHLCVPGDSFAEVAVFADFQLPASAQAIKPTRCVLIPAADFCGLLDQRHELCRQMLAGMAFWTRHFTELLDDIVLRDAADRVLSYLQSLPRNASGAIELPSTKKDVANHLNLTSETFSRVLRRLTDEGAIAPRDDQRIALR